MVWTSFDRKDLEKTGVTRYDKNVSCEGINIYCSENMPGGKILDMQGNVLYGFSDTREQKANWKLIEPYRDSHFLVIIEDGPLFLIDYDSNIKWTRPGRFHHDVAVNDNGDIYGLVNKVSYSPRFSLTENILDNVLLVLTEDNRIKREISFARLIAKHRVLFAAARNEITRERYYGQAWDIFHTNTIEIIKKDVFLKDKRLFKTGNVLFCIRHLNIIGVIDIEKEEIVWHWGEGVLDYPHCPSLLENGNILIFDNGSHRKYSRIIELDPFRQVIEWEYKGTPAESFYSNERGSAQRLPNGNTLITESDRGRVFEVTKKGEVAWEFFNPEVDREKNARATIYRMPRLEGKKLSFMLVGLVLLLSIKAYAYDNHDFQVWNTDVEELKVDNRTKIALEEEFRWGDNASQFYYHHYDLGLSYAPRTYLNVGGGYRQVYELKSGIFRPEEEPYLTVTLLGSLKGFNFDDRNRLEYRHFNYQADTWRYRNKFTVKLPWKCTRMQVQPYVSDEVFIGFGTISRFSENRFFSGLSFNLAKNIKTEVYYMLRCTKGIDMWIDSNVLGIKLKLTL